MNEFVTALQRSKLFCGMSPAEIGALLGCLGSRVRTYEKNEMLFRGGDIVCEIGIVLSGHAHSIKDDLNGKTVIVSFLETGSLIGILLATSGERKSPVSVQAADNLKVLFIPFEKVLRRCAKLCPGHELLQRRVFEGIAEKALLLHDRNDCLIQSTVRDKILTYLNREARDNNASAFSVSLDRNAMAAYLNVDRSALSRELSRMKKDGLISFNKNSFELLVTAD